MASSFENQTNLFRSNMHFNNNGIIGLHLYIEVIIMATAFHMKRALVLKLVSFSLRCCTTNN